MVDAKTLRAIKPPQKRITVGGVAEFTEAQLRNRALLVSYARMPHPYTIMVYSMMYRTESILRAAYRIMRMLLSAQVLRLEPKSDDITSAERDIIDALNQAFLTPKNVRTLISGLWYGMCYGFVPLQVVWSYENGVWLPTDVVIENAFFFRYLPHTKKWIGYDENYAEFDASNPLQFVFYTYEEQVGRHYGNALFETAKRPWLLKRMALDDWIITLDRFGSPWILGQCPRTWSEDDRKEFMNDLAGIHTHAVVTYNVDDQGYPHVEIVQPSAQHINMFTSGIEKMDAEMVHAILGPALVMLEAQYGTRAQAAVQSEQVLHPVITSLVGEFSSFIESTLVRYVSLINLAREPREFASLRVVQSDKLTPELLNMLATYIRLGLRVRQKDIGRQFGIDVDDEHASAPVPGVPIANVEPIF